MKETWVVFITTFMMAQEVAVKTFKENVSNEKIIHSAKQLQKINHENIVRFIGFCCEPALLVFECCEVAFGKIIIHTI